jgi:fucose 4-O-acetylase-like acetyltransferase
MRERTYLFDNIKAILIFSVVIAHYCRMSGSFAPATVGGVIYTISFSYIMQGFLFVSGYFSKNLERCRATAFQTFLFPYLILMPIMFLIRYLIFGRAHLDYTLPTMALWYLLTLFVYRFLIKDLVRIKNILPISIVISLAAGFIPFLDSTLSLGRTFSFLPFFLLGYYFKEEWIERVQNVPKAAGIFVLAVLLAVCVSIAYFHLLPLSALYMKASYGATGLAWYRGIAIRAVILILSGAWIFVFLNLVPKGRTFLVVVGQNTMAIYVLHIVVRYIIKYFRDFFGQDVLSYLILAMSAMLSLWLFSRPAVVKGYQSFMDTLYRWIILRPLALIRRGL